MARRKTALMKDLARQRAILLYKYAVEKAEKGKYSLSKRYISLGLELLKKANVRKPMVYRRGVCKNCGVPLIPGVTTRVRIKRNRKEVIITKTCLLCGYVVRIPCRRKEKLRKQ